MDVQNPGQVQVVPLAFDNTVKSLKRRLKLAGLNVVRQFNISEDVPGQAQFGAPSCALLMVDCPLLLFEALAFDRSAAVFMPFHIVITGDRHTTRISWTHPAEAMGLRLSASARGPVDDLYTRLTSVLKGADSWPS